MHIYICIFPVIIFNVGFLQPFARGFRLQTFPQTIPMSREWARSVFSHGLGGHICWSGSQCAVNPELEVYGTLW